MTMTEALEKMSDDHSQELTTESRLQVRFQNHVNNRDTDPAQMRAMIRKAQLLTHDEEDSLRYLKAVAVSPVRIACAYSTAI